MNRIAVLALVGSSVALSGCASAVAGLTKGVLDKVFEPGATAVEVTFKASAGINPDPSNRPSPLVVRLYELSSLGAFERADFFSLYEDDTSILGTDLQGSEELQILPGETKSLERELKPDSKYVAVLAAYRDIENANWRGTIEVELEETTPLLVTLDNLAVSIAVIDD